MTDIERRIAERNGWLDKLYSDRIVELIRERYTLNQELAISRQRDTKEEEFKAYFEFCEECKKKAKQEIYG